MIEKLNKFDLKNTEIEKLKTFESRDGFTLLDNTEFEEMERYFKEFPIYRNLVAFSSDDNSNYWCIYINGPLKGMICYLNHDEPNLEPKFRDISSFLKAIYDNPEAYDFNDLEETSFDFPNSTKEIEFDERKEILEKLFSEFNSENHEDLRQQIAFSIIALTLKEEIEDNIYPFLFDEDMYVQERAIQILGFHKYKPAKEKLIELKKTTMFNGQTDIGIVQKK